MDQSEDVEHGDLITRHMAGPWSPTVCGQPDAIKTQAGEISVIAEDSQETGQITGHLNRSRREPRR